MSHADHGLVTLCDAMVTDMDSVMLIILPRPPGNDAVWPPKACSSEGLVGFRHLAARPVGRDSGDSDAQIGGDVGGSPPLGIGIWAGHMAHRTATRDGRALQYKLMLYKYRLSL